MDQSVELAEELVQFGGDRYPAAVAQNWARQLGRGLSVVDLLKRLNRKRRAGGAELVPLYMEPGHYYSPIVDPETVRSYYRTEQKRGPRDLPGIDLDMPAIQSWWRRLLPTMEPADFPAEPNAQHRFCSPNINYPFFDAAVLRALIAELKPRRIVEVGSGNSTACMLDTIEEFGLDTNVTCIEPNPERLLDRLREGDLERLTLIKSGVQDADLAVFDALEAGDILFIDSTHVLKTGSDVLHELFYLLPRLAKGVFIHFHDCPFPFEYPPRWVFEMNHSWNELYALRAFLMYNQAFSVRVWPTLMAREFPETVATLPEACKMPLASGLWIEKIA